MSDWLQLTRRRCLTLVVGSLAAISWPWPRAMASVDDLHRRGREAARWRRQLRSPKSAAIVGSAYLALVPQADIDLIDDLAASVGRPSSDLSDADLRCRLRDRIRMEYGEGRTLRLHGWTLSRTEAQLCALYALDTTTT